MFEFLLLSAAKPAALRSQQVVLTGFVLRGRAGGFVLARMVITCCAADASTAAVEVNAPGPVPAGGSWVRVTGRYTGTEPDTDQTPMLAATAVTVIDQPANPYDH
jgi:putative membrane protein